MIRVLDLPRDDAKPQRQDLCLTRALPGKVCAMPSMQVSSYLLCTLGCGGEVVAQVLGTLREYCVDSLVI